MRIYFAIKKRSKCEGLYCHNSHSAFYTATGKFSQSGNCVNILLDTHICVTTDIRKRVSYSGYGYKAWYVGVIKCENRPNVCWFFIHKLCVRSRVCKFCCNTAGNLAIFHTFIIQIFRVSSSASTPNLQVTSMVKTLVLWGEKVIWRR